MAGLIPFSRRNTNMVNGGFDDFYGMLDDFFTEAWPFRRAFVNDSFKVDLQENDKEYLVEAQLPGVKKDEVELDLREGRLTISVKREENVSDEKKNYVHRETRYCSMCRSVVLPEAKEEGVRAKLDNGVLTVTVPKSDKPNHNNKIEIE